MCLKYLKVPTYRSTGKLGWTGEWAACRLIWTEFEPRPVDSLLGLLITLRRRCAPDDILRQGWVWRPTDLTFIFFGLNLFVYLLFIYSFIHFFQVRLTHPCPWYGECALFSMCSSSFVADISHEPALSFINTVAVSRFVLSRWVCKISSNAQSIYSYVFGSLWSESPLLIFHGERFRNIYSRKHIIKYCSPS